MNVTSSSPSPGFDIKAMQFAYDFHVTMRENKLMLAYEGDVSQQLTKAFGAMAEESLEKEDEDTKVKRRVFHVMVESLQNLSKHSDDAETGSPRKPGAGIFLVSKEEDAYFITTGNVVANDKVEVISDKIDHINSLDKAELKAHYKKHLRENRLSGKGGAGLGFIDMAKKTGNPIEYHFIELNDKTSFFLHKIKISRS